MGRPFAPSYGEDLGSAVETAEKALKRLKSNKFGEEELFDLKIKLEDVLDVIENYIKDESNK